MGAGDTEKDPQRWTRLHSISQHPIIVLCGLILAALAAVAGIWSDSGLRDLVTESPQSGPTTQYSIPPTPPVPEGSARPTVGTCLDVGGSRTPCDTEHAAEVFNASGDCSSDALLGYLGGAAGEDVLRDNLPINTVILDAATVCSIGSPDGMLEGPNKDALLGSNGDRWRRCGDELGRDTSCAGPHKSEVVFDRGASAEPLDCPTRAEAFLGRPYGQVSDDLALRQNGRLCVIEVRGDNMLTRSLRRLGVGSEPFPVTARSGC
jgi:hypothetical protein